MNLLGSLIPEPYAILARIGVVILVLAGAFTTGWVKRGQHDEDKIEAQLVKDQTKIIRIDHTQTIINNDLVKELQGKVNNLKSQNTDLQNRLKFIPDTCVLSKEWTDLYNESIEAPKVTP